MLAANALYLIAGTGVLWGIRGWRSLGELLRLLGLAYVLGVATVATTATLLLIAGSGLGLAITLAVPIACAAAGVALGHARGRRFPRRLASGGQRGERLLLVGIVSAALTVVLLEAFFRAARLQGLVGYDAFAFWVPKAKAIYFFGGLDPQLFRTLPGPSYPLLAPALQALDFRLMGAADATTIALQYWFLLAGFVGAAAGLLRPRVPLVLIWPFLGLATLMPELDKRMLNPQGDWPLDIFFALTALCLAVWVLDREPWLLGAAALLCGALMATKREGQLLTACLVVGTLAATWRTWRRSWPALVGVAAFGYLVNVPWHVWWTSRSLPSENPDQGVGSLSATASRVGPAFRVVLELLFSWHLWLVAVPLGLAAAAIAIGVRDYALPALYLLTTGLAVVGFTWILWSIPSLPLDTSQRTPIPRAVGSVVLLSIVFAPLLLSRVLARTRGAPAGA